MTYIRFALNEKCPLYYTYRIVTGYEDTEDLLGHRSQTPPDYGAIYCRAEPKQLVALQFKMVEWAQ